jgi:hypothetical protein
MALDQIQNENFLLKQVIASRTGTSPLKRRLQEILAKEQTTSKRLFSASKLKELGPAPIKKIKIQE